MKYTVTFKSYDQFVKLVKHVRLAAKKLKAYYFEYKDDLLKVYLYFDEAVEGFVHYVYCYEDFMNRAKKAIKIKSRKHPKNTIASTFREPIDKQKRRDAIYQWLKYITTRGDYVGSDNKFFHLESFICNSFSYAHWLTNLAKEVGFDYKVTPKVYALMDKFLHDEFLQLLSEIRGNTDKMCDTVKAELKSVKKVPMEFVSPLLQANASLALLNGANKYGLANYTAERVSKAMYVGAIERHLALYKLGETYDEDGVPHLGAISGGISILLSAKEAGTLIEDMPKCDGQLEAFKQLNKIVEQVDIANKGKHNVVHHYQK